MTQTDPSSARAEQFTRRLLELSGLASPADAERIARAVFSVMLEQLEPGDRRWLESALPPGLRHMAPAQLPHRVDDLVSFSERIAGREGVDPRFALEHAQAVCRALSESMSSEERTQLLNRIPDTLVPLWAVPKVAPPPPSARSASSRNDHTLATGAPGSRHPVAEAAPATAHRHSVARSDNPHADSKLASGRGTTQEREDETLATAHPGPRRDED